MRGRIALPEQFFEDARYYRSTHVKKRPKSEEVEEKMSGATKYFFTWLVFICQVLLFGSIGLTIYWVYTYHKGLAWKNQTDQQYNLHYVLMTAGFIFFNGQSILVYRSYPCCTKIVNKVVHSILFLAAIACIILGLVSAIQAQNNKIQPTHFYSIHSWIGLVAMGIFALQFVLGFFSFFVLLCCEKQTASYRQSLVPIHSSFGLIIFALGVAAVVTGLTQTARSRLSGKNGSENYSDLEGQAIIVNTIAMAAIGLSILIPFIIRYPKFQRSKSLKISD